jgi:hypothetical protein
MLTIAIPPALRRCLLALPLCVGGISAANAQQAVQTDIILRLDGSEVSGRVLTISPLLICYLPPARSDTLRLATAEVFLIRYANGTREVLNPTTATAAPPAADPLVALNDAQRRRQGRQDAAHYPANGPFWGSLGATLYGGPLLGVLAPALIAPHSIASANLKAPDPSLLADPAYDSAYRQEAQRRKRGRTWGGYALGAGVWVVFVSSILAGLR